MAATGESFERVVKKAPLARAAARRRMWACAVGAPKAPSHAANGGRRQAGAIMLATLQAVGRVCRAAANTQRALFSKRISVTRNFLLIGMASVCLRVLQQHSGACDADPNAPPRRPRRRRLDCCIGRDAPCGPSACTKPATITGAVATAASIAASARTVTATTVAAAASGEKGLLVCYQFVHPAAARACILPTPGRHLAPCFYFAPHDTTTGQISAAGRQHSRCSPFLRLHSSSAISAAN